MSQEEYKTSTANPSGAAENPVEEIQPRKTDKHIWGIYIALCIVSVIELYSASSHEVTAANVFAPVIRHGIFLFIGLIIMLTLQGIHYRKFFKWSYIFAILSFLAMVYTLFKGDYINGARRSFTLLFFTIQPSEMVKISAVFLIAAILSRAQMRKAADVTNTGLWLVTACVGIAGGLLVMQGLTNTALLMGISLSMMMVGGVSFAKLGKVILAFGVIAGILVGAKFMMGGDKEDVATVSEPLQVPGTSVVVGTSEKASAGKVLGRWDTWVNRIQRHLKLDKFNDPITDKNQQEMYSFMAQANGGVTGVGPGNSRETARLPLAFSDYIYAIVVEELGLVGGIVVLILYLWLLARAGVVSRSCQTAFPALLVIGMAVFIVFQALFHMAIVTGVFPVSGQPLPLISKGGTSILITSLALGVMLSVSRFAARKGQKTEIKEELKALPDEIAAASML